MHAATSPSVAPILSQKKNSGAQCFKKSTAVVELFQFWKNFGTQPTPLSWCVKRRTQKTQIEEGAQLAPAGHYRRLAAQLRAKARDEHASHLRAEWEHLADCYIRLAEQADRNTFTDITYEPPFRPPLDDGEPA
jgi:hypothetical protein